MNDVPEELSCATKLVFDTKREAEVAAIVAKYQRGVVLQAYQCEVCGLWHLSSTRSE